VAERDELMAHLREYNRLIKERNAAYRMIARDSALSETAFWTLYVLCMHRRPISQADVCHECLSPKQTVNSALGRLCEQGLVRLATDGCPEGDARRRLVELTEPGREFCDRHVMPVIELELHSLSSLGDQLDSCLLLLSEESEAFLDGASRLGSDDQSGTRLGLEVPIRAPSEAASR
jgi:DNA-binding MarR family transcriptional regulator